MNIPMTATVYCTDGAFGRATAVVVRPQRPMVTHIIVKEDARPHLERLLPVALITKATEKEIRLSANRKQAAEADPLWHIQYAEAGDVALDPSLMWPESLASATELRPTAVAPTATPSETPLSPTPFPKRPQARVTKHLALPEEALVIKHNIMVEAKDGPVGRLKRLQLDPQTGLISHLVVSDWNLLGRDEVTIPAGEIEHYSEQAIDLKLDKLGVGALPAVHFRRFSGGRSRPVGPEAR